MAKIAPLKYILPFVFILLYSCNYDKNLISGCEVFSIDSVKYGRFEVKMKMAPGNGILSTFFLFNHNSSKGSPFPWQEIDLESLGDNSIQTNIITGYLEKQVKTERRKRLKKDIFNTYNVYAIEWTPDYVAWYFNEELVRVIRANEYKNVLELRNAYMSYRFNIWPSKKFLWCKWMNGEKLPAYQSVDYIKYFEYDPKSESKFKLSWTDDFSSFDRRRWALANWTFPENMSIFSPNNGTVLNDKLVLKLSGSNRK